MSCLQGVATNLDRVRDEIKNGDQKTLMMSKKSLM